MNIQHEIKELMEKYNLSREDIASKLGVSFMSVYRWEKGEVEPKSKMVEKAIESLKEELGLSQK